MTNDFKPAKAGGNQPRLSKEEYAEKKRAEKEKVYQMIDDAAREIVSDPEKFKSFLDTQSRMDRYSAANALLIYSQYPQATQLKDFDDWGKDNVKITKGAKSISILEPVEYTRADGSPGISYNVKKVFDVTQTNGRKAPAVSANRDPKALITTMFDVSPVEVAATDELPYPNMAAFYNNEKQTLYVKRNVGDSVAVAQCVAQELGHAQLSINSESYSRRDMGFVLCSRPYPRRLSADACSFYDGRICQCFTAGRLRQDTVGYAFPWGICKHHLTELGTA